MLTKQLRELEADGLVNRIVYAEVPPRVEYELTASGEYLMPIIGALKTWGEQNGPTLLARREDQEIAPTDGNGSGRRAAGVESRDDLIRKAPIAGGSATAAFR